jgi:hypothetical protein
MATKVPNKKLQDSEKTQLVKVPTTTSGKSFKMLQSQPPSVYPDKALLSSIIGPMISKYSEPHQLAECSARLLKARAAPFSSLKSAPCNTSATASNTIRFKTYLQTTGAIGTRGWGFASMNTKSAACNDIKSLATSTDTYGSEGIDVTAGGVNLDYMTGSFFELANLTSAVAVKARRVAGGIEIIPIASPYSAKGYFKPWQGQGDDAQLSVSSADYDFNSLAPIVGYAPDKKYLTTWTPSSSDDENWIPSSAFGEVVTSGVDIASCWIKGNVGDAFIVRYIMHYEAESFKLFNTLALPSEHDPAGAAAVSTAMTRVVRTNFAVPSNSEDGFLDKAWNWIKSEGGKLLDVALPSLASKAGEALLGLL